MSRRPSSRNTRGQNPECFESQEEVRGCDDARYDPKELRDAARILSPFLRLLDDVNNPYARIVAREVCDTFYSLFHPNKDPAEVFESFRSVFVSQKSVQMWNEFRLYTTGKSCKEWVPLCKRKSPPKQAKNAQCTPKKSPACPKEQMDCILPSMCDDNHEQLCDISQPADMGWMRDLSAGSDSLPLTHNCSPDVEKTTYSPLLTRENQEDASRLDYDDEMYDNEPRRDVQQVEAVDTTCYGGMSEDTIGGNEIDNNTLIHASIRQHAGNDGCPQPSGTEYVDNPAQFEYYRVTGNTPPRKRLSNEMKQSTEEPVGVTNDACVTSDNKVSNEVTCNSKMVANAYKNLTLASQDLCKKKKAFKTLTKNYLNNSLNDNEENDELQCSTGQDGRKKTNKMNRTPQDSPYDDDEWNDNAFKDRDFVRLLPFYETVHNQLEYISKTQRDYGVNMLDDVMSTLYHIHYDLGDPRLKNDMLIEHVKLVTKNTWEAYFYPGCQKMPAIPADTRQLNSPPRASCQQQEPQCPSPRQVTPRQQASQCPSPRQATPRQQEPQCPSPRHVTPRQQVSQCPSPRQATPQQEMAHSSSPRQLSPLQEMSQHSSPVQVRSQHASPKPPNQVPPALEKVTPKPSRQGKQPPSRARPSTAGNRRPSSKNCDKAQDVCSNPPVETKRSFLRRSQVSGAPKAWAPKVKAVERPKDSKVFKAKPLPKYVRDRLNSRDENC